jgi:hypothetical protein
MAATCELYRVALGGADLLVCLLVESRRASKKTDQEVRPTLPGVFA